MSRERSFKVIHLAPTPFFSDRGCHIRIQGIMGALEKNGDRNILCTYHHGRNVPGITVERISPIKGYQKTEAGPHPLKYYADLKLLALAWRLVWREKPDVLHAHLHEGVLIAWMVKLCFFWRRIPLVADIQGSLVGELDTHDYFRSSRLLYRLFWTIEYFISRLPTHIFCSSALSKEILERNFRISPDKIDLVNDRVDVSAFDGSKVRSSPCPIVVPTNKTVVVYSGSLLEAKGLGELYKILQELFTRRDDVYAMLIGYPIEKTKDALEQMGIQDQCALVGRVPFEELPRYLNAAHVGVDPKHADAGEGSGKIINYMAAGLPVVCFDTANNRRLLGEEGRYARRDAIDEFVDRIEELVDTPDLRNQVGMKNRQRAEEKLSWDDCGRVIHAVYEAL